MSPLVVLDVDLAHIDRHHRQAARFLRRQHAALRGEADHRLEFAGVDLFLQRGRQARAVRAAAMDLGSEELIRAEAELRAGRTPAGTRDVETRQGRLRVATAIERQATRRHLVRISVADHGGEVLSTYETVVEVERR